MRNHRVKNLAEKSKLLSNVKLLTYLKMMYYMGYLPVSWITQANGSSFKENKFEVNLRNSIKMACLDILIASVIIAYLPVWHLLNMGPSFDLAVLAKPDYYISIFQVQWNIVKVIVNICLILSN
jgi:hypothetical protein